ncbi:CoA transferase [Acetobacter pomorum]|uniref:CoA transferase n=1 Tax=Acetobacter pomorum TaxID=65959 RepID=A0A2G4R9T3_9PROT|nr:CoA transferase [Acetobacter pomorum]PHY93292.1 CoA transferase [Acetobacter pomorum]GBR49449.1 putative acyl-CoA transferase [Acetobacter pomorum DSM 11825]
MSDKLPNLPLAGVRVVDFSRVLSGPYCTALLADMGAEVIKIESPTGDDYRHVAPFKNGESALFTQVNRGKKSVVVDLRTPDGQKAVRHLVSTADAVVENFRPGVASRLGVGWDDLKSVNSSLVFLSISGFGQTGPWAHKAAYDVIIQGLCGLMSVTGQPDGPPTLVGEAVADVVAGMFGAWALTTALFERERKGGREAPGRYIDLSMFDSMLSFMVTSTTASLFTGEVPMRVGNRHPLSAPFGCYTALDGYFSLAVLNKKLFSKLCKVIGAEHLLSDERFATDLSRSTHESILRDYIEKWSGARNVAEIVSVFETEGVPCGPLLNVVQALSSDQAEARNILVPVEDRRLPQQHLVRQPAVFSGVVQTSLRRAPKLGEHTRELLS